MPSLKRRSGDLRTEVLESASSALRPSHINKRPRLSTVEIDDRASRESSIVTEANLPSTQFEALGNILQNYEEARDEVSDLSTDEEAEQLDQATQQYRKHRSNHVENLAADSGILMSVDCRDFMCHRWLHVDFGPLINFIIGHNGSGKSAVLTAITLCLGGKPTSTNRGQSLRSFVREGADKSILTVKIKNKGVGAYKRDLYGDVIIVERSFNIHGGSGFALKSKDGRIINKKKTELEEITDFFTLQLDNPVNVLTQDQARQFLNNSSDSEKYRFFMKGVQLEQLDQDYCILGEQLDTTEETLKVVKQDCHVLKEKYDVAKKKRDLSQRQETLRERIKKYSRQMAWAQIIDQEQQLERAQALIEERNAIVEEREEDFRNCEARFDQANQVSEEAQRDLDQVKEERRPLEEEHQIAKDAFDKVREDISSCQTTAREIKQALMSERKRMQEAQKDVDEEYHRLNDRSDGRENEKRAEIRDAEVRLEDIKEQGGTHDQQIPQLQQARQQADEQLSNAYDQEKKKQAAVRDAQRQLQELQKENRDKFAPFDRNLPDVLRTIERERSFRNKPIGPLAWHVRNKMPRWQNIIERTFGGLLNNFIVTSREDQVKLSEILRRHRCAHAFHVIVADPNFRMPRLLEPDSRFNTILRTLEIDNDLVRNQLIITTAIEQTILVDTQEEAIKLTEHNMPGNCKAIMCPHPTERGRGFRYMQGRGGSQKLEPVDPWRGPPRMKTDDQAAISSQQEMVQDLKQELFQAEQAKRQAETSKTQAQQALVAHKRTGKDLLEQSQRAEDLIEELKSELEAMQPQDGKLDGLKAQLEEHRQQVDHLLQQEKDAKEERENIALQNRDNKKALDDLSSQIHAKDVEITEAEKKVNKYKERRMQSLTQKNEADHSREDAAKEVESAQRMRDKQQQTLRDWTAQAEEICARVPVDEGEDANSLDKKLSRMHQELQNFQERVGGDERSIELAYIESKKALKGAERQFLNTNAIVNSLKLSLNDRVKTWLHFRSYITKSARVIFKHLMRERGFQGEMLIDHKAQKLHLKVNPDTKRAQNDAGRQTKTLSGGEKSFSTVCMLLALWEAMGSPIRCLDEFDVFMDSVNRDLAMRMMIESARGAIGRQFVLITPQAMGGVDYGPDVRIHLLKDPERGQATLSVPSG